MKNNVGKILLGILVGGILLMRNEPIRKAVFGFFANRDETMANKDPAKENILTIPSGIGIFKIDQELPSLFINSKKLGFDYQTENKLNDYEIAIIKNYKHDPDITVDLKLVTKANKLIYISVENPSDANATNTIERTYDKLIDLFGHGTQKFNVTYARCFPHVASERIKSNYVQWTDIEENWKEGDIEISYQGTVLPNIPLDKLPNDAHAFGNCDNHIYDLRLIFFNKNIYPLFTELYQENEKKKNVEQLMEKRKKF